MKITNYLFKLARTVNLIGKIFAGLFKLLSHLFRKFSIKKILNIFKI